MPSHDRPPHVPKPPEKDSNFWLQVGRYSQLAFVFPAATAVGWLVGSALDRWLHKSWISIVGLLVGIVSGFVELIRTVLASSDSD
jgi:F0F1-type ATP synthase assembly protein I